MDVPAERLHRLPRVPSERRLELVVQLRVASADAREDPDFRDETGREASRVPRDLQHAAPAMAKGIDGDGQRDEQPPAGPQRIEPDRAWMRGPRVHEDGIAGPGVVLATIRPNDDDVGQVAQIVAGPCGEVWIELDGRDVSVGTDDGGQDRRVVADPAADVDSMIPGLEVEGVKAEGKKTGLSIVEAPGRVDRDQDVVIQVPRVSIFGGSVREAIPAEPGRKSATGPARGTARAGPSRRPS